MVMTPVGGLLQCLYGQWSGSPRRFNAVLGRHVRLHRLRRDHEYDRIGWQKLSALLKMLRAGLTWIPGKLRDLSKGYFATTFLSSKMALQRAIAS
jgi:hypothetical protein